MAIKIEDTGGELDPITSLPKEPQKKAPIKIHVGDVSGYEHTTTPVETNIDLSGYAGYATHTPRSPLTMDTLNDIRAYELGFLSEAGNMVVQTGGELVGGVVQGVGLLFDWNPDGKSNPVAELGSWIRNKSKEIAPIYQQSGNSAGSWGEWVMSTIPSFVSLASTLIPGVGVVGMLNKAGMLGKAGSLANKILSTGISTGISRHIEGSMEMEETYNSEFTKLKNTINPATGEYFTDVEADQLATGAAVDTYKRNWSLVALDAIQMAGLFNKAGFMGALGNGKLSTTAFVGLEALPEGFEEFMQYGFSNDAQYWADVKAGIDGGLSTSERWQHYAKQSEAWQAITGGLFGGALMATPVGERIMKNASSYAQFSTPKRDYYRMEFALTENALGLINQGKAENNKAKEELGRIHLYNLMAASAIENDFFENKIADLQKIIETGDVSSLSPLRLESVDQAKEMLDNLNEIKSLYDKQLSTGTKKELALNIAQKQYFINRAKPLVEELSKNLTEEEKALHSFYSEPIIEGVSSAPISENGKAIVTLRRAINQLEAEAANYQDTLENDSAIKHISDSNREQARKRVSEIKTQIDKIEDSISKTDTTSAEDLAKRKALREEVAKLEDELIKAKEDSKKSNKQFRKSLNLKLDSIRSLIDKLNTEQEKLLANYNNKDHEAYGSKKSDMAVMQDIKLNGYELNKKRKWLAVLKAEVQKAEASVSDIKRNQAEYTKESLNADTQREQAAQQQQEAPPALNPPKSKPEPQVQTQQQSQQTSGEVKKSDKVKAKIKESGKPVNNYKDIQNLIEAGVLTYADMYWLVKEANLPVKDIENLMNILIDALHTIYRSHKSEVDAAGVDQQKIEKLRKILPLDMAAQFEDGVKRLREQNALQSLDLLIDDLIKGFSDTTNDTPNLEIAPKESSEKEQPSEEQNDLEQDAKVFEAKTNFKWVTSGFQFEGQDKREQSNPNNPQETWSGTDWSIINDGHFAKDISEAVVHLEFVKYNNPSFNNEDNFPMQYVAYINVAGQQRRVVLGTVLSYSKTGAVNSKSPDNKALRQILWKEYQKADKEGRLQPAGSNIGVPSGFTTSLVNYLPFQFWNTDTNHKPTTNAGELVLGIATEELVVEFPNLGAESKFSANYSSEGNKKARIGSNSKPYKKGNLFMYVLAPNGNYVPSLLRITPLNERSDWQQFQSMLMDTELTSTELAQFMIDRFFPKSDRDKIIAMFNSRKVDLEKIGKLMPLDFNSLNVGDNNKIMSDLGYITSDANEGNMFHSTGFEFNVPKRSEQTTQKTTSSKKVDVQQRLVEQRIHELERLPFEEDSKLILEHAKTNYGEERYFRQLKTEAGKLKLGLKILDRYRAEDILSNKDSTIGERVTARAHLQNDRYAMTDAMISDVNRMIVEELSTVPAGHGKASWNDPTRELKKIYDAELDALEAKPTVTPSVSDKKADIEKELFTTPISLNNWTSVEHGKYIELLTLRGDLEKRDLLRNLEPKDSWQLYAVETLSEEEADDILSNIKEAKKADIEIGKVGNTEYEVKADGVYYQGKKLDNPNNLSHRQLIEADIGRRRKEELKERVVYDRKPTVEDGEFRIVGDPNKSVYRINENTGRLQVKDRETGLWTVEGTHGKIELETAQRIGFEKLKEAINAKYDAELAALGQSKKTLTGVQKTVEGNHPEHIQKLIDRSVTFQLTDDEAYYINKLIADDIEKRRQEELIIPNTNTSLYDSVKKLEKGIEDITNKIAKLEKEGKGNIANQRTGVTSLSGLATDRKRLKDVREKELEKINKINAEYDAELKNNKYDRVTSVTQKKDEAELEKDHVKSSFNIGRGLDRIARDFFKNDLKSFEEYGTIESKEEFNNFINDLKNLKKLYKDWTVVTDRIVVFNDELKVAGEIDILMYNSKGEVAIFDFKTQRGNKFTTDYGQVGPDGKILSKYDTTELTDRDTGKKTTIESDREKHKKQINLYRILLYNTDGILANKLGIVPIGVSYPVEGVHNTTPRAVVHRDFIYNPVVEDSITLIDGRVASIKTPNNPTPKNDTTIDSSDADDLLDALESKVPGVNTTLTRPELINWVNRVFGGKISVKDMDEVLSSMFNDLTIDEADALYNLTQRAEAITMLRHMSIYLSDNAYNDIGFHEAFHGIYGLYLSPQEQKSLIEQTIAKRVGSYNPLAYLKALNKTDLYRYIQPNKDGVISYRGVSLDLKELKRQSEEGFTKETLKDIEKLAYFMAEEELAEGFRKYMNTKKIDKNFLGKVHDFFIRLLQAIKAFVGVKASDLDIFKRIDSGYYRNRKFVTIPKVIQDTIVETPESRIKGFSTEEEQQAMGTMMFIADKIFSDARSKYGMHEDSLVKVIKRIAEEYSYGKLMEHLEYAVPHGESLDTFDMNYADIPALQVILEQIQAGIDSYLTKFESSSKKDHPAVKKLRELRDKILTEINGKTYIADAGRVFIDYLERLNVKSKIKDSRFESEEDDNAVDAEEWSSLEENVNPEKRYNESAYEKSAFLNAPAEVRMAMELMPKMYYDKSGALRQQAGYFVMPQMEDPVAMFAFFRNNLAGIHDPELFLNRLDRIAEQKPGAKDFVNKVKSDPQFAALVWNSFNLQHPSFHSVAEGEDGKLKIINLSVTNLRQHLERNWEAGLLNSRVFKNGQVDKPYWKQLGQISDTIQDAITRQLKDPGKAISIVFKGSELPLGDALSRFYNEFGIYISPETFRRMRANPAIGAQGLQQMLTEFNRFMDIIYTGKNPYKLQRDTQESKDFNTWFISLMNSIKQSDEGVITDAVRFGKKNIFTYFTSNEYSERFNRDLRDSNWLQRMSEDVNMRHNLFVKNAIESRKTNIPKYDLLSGDISTYGEPLEVPDMIGTKYAVAKLLAWHNNGYAKKGTYFFPVQSSSPVIPLLREVDKFTTEECIERLLDVARQEYVRNQAIKDNGLTGYAKNRDFVYVTVFNNKDINLEDSPGVFTKDPNKLNVLRSIIKSWIIEEAKRHLAPLESAGMLKKVGPDLYRPLHSFPADIQKEILVPRESDGALFPQNRSDKDISDDVLGYLTNYAANQIYINTQIFQITQVDHKFVKENQSPKRAKKGWSPRHTPYVPAMDNTHFYLIAVEKNTINSLYTDEILNGLELAREAGSITENEYMLLRDNWIANKDNVIENTNDSQALMNVSMTLNMLKGYGQFDSLTKQMLNDVKKGRPSKIAIGQDLQKPFWSGIVDLRGQNINFNAPELTHMQLKISTGVLLQMYAKYSPAIAKMLEIEETLKEMYGNDINVMFMDVDGSKAFTPPTISKDDIMSFDAKDSNRVASIAGKAVKIPHNIGGKQQETPEHYKDTYNSDPTQARTLQFTDFRDDYQLSSGRFGAEVKAEFAELMAANLLESAEEVYNESFKDIYKVQETLLEAFARLGYTSLASDAIKIMEDGRFNVPMYSSKMSYKLQSILNAVWKKGVTQQSSAGAQLVQMAVFNFQTREEIEALRANGEEVYVPKPMRAENGKIVGAEVYMPAWTRKLFKKGELLSITDERVMEMVGIRIPTEHKYSMLPMKVVGFLPEEMGGKILLPEEITRIAGSDFDVDKMFLLMAELDKDGNYIEYDHTKSPQENSRAARNNRKLEIMKELLLDPLAYADHYSIGGYANLKNFMKALGTATEIKDVCLPSTQDRVFNDIHAGSPLIGRAALHNKAHTIFQNSNIRFKDGIKLFDHVFDEKATSASALFEEYILDKLATKDFKDSKGLKRITQSVREVLAAAVDNEKDPVLGSLNINSLTVDFFMTMLHTGIPLFQALSFITHPALRELSMEYFSALGEGKSSAYSKAVDRVMSKYDIDKLIIRKPGKEIPMGFFNPKFVDVGGDTKVAIYTIQAKFEKDGIPNTKTIGRDLDPENIRLMLSLFNQYKKRTDAVGTLVTSLRSDTAAAGPSVSNTENILNKREEMINSEVFDGADEVLIGKNLTAIKKGQTIQPFQVRYYNKKEKKSDVAWVVDTKIDPVTDKFMVILENGQEEFIHEVFDLDLESYPWPLVPMFYYYGIYEPHKFVSELFPYESPSYQFVKKVLSDYKFIRPLNESELRQINSQGLNFLTHTFEPFRLANQAEFADNLYDRAIAITEKYPDLYDTVFFKGLNRNQTKRELFYYGSMARLQNDKERVSKDIERLYREDTREGVREFMRDLIIYDTVLRGREYNPQGLGEFIPEDILHYDFKDSSGRTYRDYIYDMVDQMKAGSGVFQDLIHNFVRNFGLDFLPKVNPKVNDIDASLFKSKGILRINPSDKNIESGIVKQFKETFVYPQYISYIENSEGKRTSFIMANIGENAYVRIPKAGNYNRIEYDFDDFKTSYESNFIKYPDGTTRADMSYAFEMADWLESQKTEDVVKTIDDKSKRDQANVQPKDQPKWYDGLSNKQIYSDQRFLVWYNVQKDKSKFTIDERVEYYKKCH